MKKSCFYVPLLFEHGCPATPPRGEHFSHARPDEVSAEGGEEHERDVVDLHGAQVVLAAPPRRPTAPSDVLFSPLVAGMGGAFVVVVDLARSWWRLVVERHAPLVATPGGGGGGARLASAATVHRDGVERAGTEHGCHGVADGAGGAGAGAGAAEVPAAAADLLLVSRHAEVGVDLPGKRRRRRRRRLPTGARRHRPIAFIGNDGLVVVLAFAHFLTCVSASTSSVFTTCNDPFPVFILFFSFRFIPQCKSGLLPDGIFPPVRNSMFNSSFFVGHSSCTLYLMHCIQCGNERKIGLKFDLKFRRVVWHRTVCTLVAIFLEKKQMQGVP